MQPKHEQKDDTQMDDIQNNTQNNDIQSKLNSALKDRSDPPYNTRISSDDKENAKNWNIK